jgi:hypothetical protein
MEEGKLSSLLEYVRNRSSKAFRIMSSLERQTPAPVELSPISEEVHWDAGSKVGSALPLRERSYAIREITNN